MSALSRLASCAMQAGDLPWEAVCRSVVDGIALVLHMTRIEGRRLVEKALFVKGYETTENQWVVQPVWSVTEEPSPARPDCLVPSHVLTSRP